MTTKLPILYSFRRCPYAMRARFALHLAKIPHEHREISLKDKPLEMLKISPKGTVPVLLLLDGRVLEESLDIMIWAMGGKLSPEDRDLIMENDTSFKRALDRYKYPGRYSEEENVNYRDNCVLFLEKLESRLDPFLSGDKPTLVDMALFPFIRQFSSVDPEWFEAQSYPHLKKWLNYFITSELYNKVMEKHPLWEGDI
jgi:glutathione S-transferase